MIVLNRFVDFVPPLGAAINVVDDTPDPGVARSIPLLRSFGRDFKPKSRLRVI